MITPSAINRYTNPSIASDLDLNCRSFTVYIIMDIPKLANARPPTAEGDSLMLNSMSGEVAGALHNYGRNHPKVVRYDDIMAQELNFTTIAISSTKRSIDGKRKYRQRGNRECC